MQRVGCEYGNRFSIRLAKRNERNGGIRRTGGFHEVRAASRRIHLDEVCSAEWIGRYGSGPHEPAPVENVFGGFRRSKSDLGGTQVIQGPLNPVRNSLRHKLLILVRCLLEFKAVV